jgi:hypothetical protein
MPVKICIDVLMIIPANIAIKMLIDDVQGLIFFKILHFEEFWEMGSHHVCFSFL